MIASTRSMASAWRFSAAAAEAASSSVLALDLGIQAAGQLRVLGQELRPHRIGRGPEAGRQLCIKSLPEGAALGLETLLMAPEHPVQGLL
jgi:hypothetical protein